MTPEKWKKVTADAIKKANEKEPLCIFDQYKHLGCFMGMMLLMTLEN